MAYTYAGKFAEAAFKSDGTLLKGGSVSVYSPGTTTLVTLYTDRAKGTTASNPVTTDSTDGMLVFFADPGTYDLAGPGISLSGVPVDADAAEYELANLAGATAGFAILSSGKIPIAQIPTGTSSSTVTVGNDARVTGAEQAANKNAASGYLGLDSAKRIVGQASAVTAAAGANNGTSPPAPVVGSSTDEAGTITFGSGGSPAAGAQVAVTFSVAWGSAPKAVAVTPNNAATQALGLLAAAPTTTGFTLSTANAPTASQAATVYSFSYIVRG
jgi:hypothetical protein